MRSVELDAITAALRAAPLDLTAPPEVLRKILVTAEDSGPVASDLNFEEVSLGGLSALASRPPAARDDRRLLYFHGGGYVLGSPDGHRGVTAELGRAAGVPVVTPRYRLAPEHPFPAAVDDALAAYRALLAGGLVAKSIVVGGDSAGGGLALAMLVAARDAGLPLPAAVLAISPWVDLGCAGASMETKRAEDPMIGREGLLAMARHYLQATPADHPLASPLGADLAGLPPLLIQVGSAEVLLDDATRLAARAGAAGVAVRLDVWPDMPHVWHLMQAALREGRAAIREAGRWLAARLDDPHG
jgi:monoterpene epsilon-lactone hydrolase